MVVMKIPGSEITPETIYEQRRRALKWMTSGVAGVGLAAWAQRSAWCSDTASASMLAALPSVASRLAGAYTQEQQTPFEHASGYNNFYEFGVGKADPQRYAQQMPIDPWVVEVEGLVHKPGRWDLEELLKLSPMQERVYRLRCVEGWSMVIPWIGYSLSELIRRVEPMGSAKFVEFETLADSQHMRGLKSRVLQWPYREGLRLDEAVHPLCLLCFGMYGRVLPKQSGAPLRLVVPWKYGFKSAKSIVKLRFVEQQPISAWMESAPHEYGFYANVNPDVPHRRWSQATERRLDGSSAFAPKRRTVLFNGYAEQVAHLYQGMDLQRNF
ncbi:protein-methionine-sulfoxide reductase catalytic subunit MsrP [Comamonas halotolerans]|uniref:protein-methionine-sulfoxide reductase catalytic subunit MsrP n=1 Tax=Comamonas halotolerans TaxID=3041496 RepID=UPI0039B73B66